jgi:acyl-CoA synthetase (AMP-forming)/AMP-acid ligase II/1-acyl-sn-glycerol-3-phosphate acyltransferase/acyl carrier protein
MIERAFWWVIRRILSLRYRIRVQGLHEIRRAGRSGILFLPNHPAMIDPIILLSLLRGSFRVRSLADRDQIDRFLIRRLAPRMGAMEIPDLVKRGSGARDAVRETIGQCVASLAQGDCMLLYPSGHLYRGRYEDLRGNSAAGSILQEIPDVRIVLVRTRGLWGSRLSWASGHAPQVGGILRRGLLELLISGLFFLPRREVTIDFREPDDLPRGADREVLNQYMESFYNEGAPAAMSVPATPWQRGGAREMPEPSMGVQAGNIEVVPETTRRVVSEYLRELTGKESLSDDESLARDLGLDSLSRADLIVWLEKEFGFAQGDVDALQTVADVMLAACGESVNVLISEMKPVPKKWFARKEADRLAEIPEASTTAGAFLAQALATPGKAIVADQSSGVKTYRDLLTGIFALRKDIAALEGENVGIMLPASVAADMVYLATVFAGKTPVMVNWTVGRRNMLHSLDLVGVKNILTARALTARLGEQGVDLAGLEDRMVPLERLAGGLGKTRKICAALQARFAPGSLRKVAISRIAAILFTSGSESLPKAVPLSHANILANLRAVCGLQVVRRDDRVISILPPFHSFGLTIGMLLPLCGSVSVVHHPNPTQAPMLARIIEAYRVSLLIGTPTFLGGIVRAAQGTQLDTLRLAVTGAEKCPPRVYEALARACPDAIVLEGYGVTECSPIISVNRPDAPVAGTIGKVVGSFEYAIVDVDTGRAVEAGRAGMLLVRGPCVFEGYLAYDGESPFVEFEGHRWYRTGDLVSEDADGVLTFAGRLKRFVKLGGEMISLPAIESVLLESYAEETDEGPVLAVEATPSDDHPELVLFTTRDDLDRETVNTRIRDAGLSPLHNIRRVVRVEEIPLLGTGKTDYRTLRERLAEE